MQKIAVSEYKKRLSRQLFCSKIILEIYFKGEV